MNYLYLIENGWKCLNQQYRALEELMTKLFKKTTFITQGKPIFVICIVLLLLNIVEMKENLKSPIKKTKREVAGKVES